MRIRSLCGGRWPRDERVFARAKSCIGPRRAHELVHTRRQRVALAIDGLARPQAQVVDGKDVRMGPRAAQHRRHLAQQWRLGLVAPRRYSCRVMGIQPDDGAAFATRRALRIREHLRDERTAVALVEVDVRVREKALLSLGVQPVGILNRIQLIKEST